MVFLFLTTYRFVLLFFVVECLRRKHFACRWLHTGLAATHATPRREAGRGFSDVASGSRSAFVIHDVRRFASRAGGYFRKSV